MAGFHTWKKLGRYVRKGERGIVIVAPCVTSRGNRKVGEAVQTDAQGNERREDVRKVVGFRGAYVWDVTSTDGQPLPEFARVCGDPTEYTAKLHDAIRESGIAFSMADNLGGA